MTERNPIPECLSHLEQMQPRRASNTALHYLLNDLRNYAKTLEDGDSDGVMIIAEDAAEAMLRAVESLEQMQPKPEPRLVEFVMLEYDSKGNKYVAGTTAAKSQTP